MIPAAARPLGCRPPSAPAREGGEPMGRYVLGLAEIDQSQVVIAGGKVLVGFRPAEYGSNL